MPHLEIALLGFPLIKINGRSMDTDRRKAIALLAYLAVTSKPHSREQIATLLWPDYEPERAYAYLRRTLWELNHALGKGWIDADRDSIAFRRDEDFWLDTAVFQGLLTQGRNAAAQETALSLYRGDFLAGFTIQDSPEFDTWQLTQAESLRQQLADALERLILAYEQTGKPEAALPHARRWLTLDTLNEIAHCALMRLYAKLGDRAAAIRQYEGCVRLLQDELGILPQTETTTLYEQIIRGEVPGIRLDRMGTSPAPAETIVRLPVFPMPFIGRQRELEQIRAWFQQSQNRLLTLIGPGGMGKTRLAIQAAATLRNEFADGLFFIPLVATNSGEGIVTTIARVLAFNFYDGETSPRQQLLDYLREKRALLILDNFEHLLEAENVRFIVDMLEITPVKILITSRSRLNVQEEILFPVGGMEVPSMYDMGQVLTTPQTDGALALFVDRARHVRSHFRLTPENVGSVIQICRLVEGMPLGIEMGATWLELLPPAEIASEIARNFDFLETSLQDVPERQRSLRAVFEYSWKLLDDTERVVCQRLSLFQGSFSREAAQFVSEATLRTLLGLVNKSWLQTGEDGRFQLHELLRQYTYTWLQGNEEENAAAQKRYALYYAGFVEKQAIVLQGGEQIAALDAIANEIDHLRTAWGWLVEQGQWATLTGKMLEGLYHFATIRGQREKFIAWLKLARQQFPAAEDPNFLPPKVILTTAEIYLELSSQTLEDLPIERLLQTQELIKKNQLLDKIGFWSALLAIAYLGTISLEEGYRLFQDALPTIRQQESRWHLGYSLLEVSSCLTVNSLFAEAEACLSESLNIFRQAGSVHEQAVALQWMSNIIWFYKNSPVEALQLKQAAQKLFGQVGDLSGVALIWEDLAGFYLRRGEFEQAFHAYQEQRRVGEKMGNRRIIGSSYSWESMAACRYGTLEHALDTRQRSLVFAREAGNLTDLAWHTWELGEVYRLMRDFDQAQHWYKESLDLFEKLHVWEGVGFYYQGLGKIALASGRAEEARHWFATALDYQTRIHPFDHPWLWVVLQSGLGRTFIALGKWAEAQQCFRTALQSNQTPFLVGPDTILLPVAGFASLYAAMGEGEKAVELATLVLHHRLSWNETKMEAKLVLAEASRGLTEATLVTAQEKGMAWKLDSAVAMLMGNSLE